MKTIVSSITVETTSDERRPSDLPVSVCGKGVSIPQLEDTFFEMSVSSAVEAGGLSPAQADLPLRRLCGHSSLRAGYENGALLAFAQGRANNSDDKKE